jgi:hypothetical protein
MKLINFTFDSSIELGCDGKHRYLDLHNCYDWQGFSYFSEERRIEMSWIRSNEPWVHEDLPGSLVLEFRDVSSLATRPRDSELPYTEDSCLASVTFTPPEYASNFDSEFPDYRDESEHLTFCFQSDFGLKIWASEVELLLFSEPNS